MSMTKYRIVPVEATDEMIGPADPDAYQMGHEDMCRAAPDVPDELVERVARALSDGWFEREGATPHAFSFWDARSQDEFLADARRVLTEIDGGGEKS